MLAVADWAFDNRCNPSGEILAFLVAHIGDSTAQFIEFALKGQNLDPHFIGAQHFAQFVGKALAFLGWQVRWAGRAGACHGIFSTGWGGKQQDCGQNRKL